MIKYLEPLESGNRCRKWKLVAGSDKAHRRSRVFHGGKREAERALDDFADEVMRSARVDRSTVTVAQYERIWLDKLARGGSVDNQTIDGYKWRLNAVCHSTIKLVHTYGANFAIDTLFLFCRCFKHAMSLCMYQINYICSNHLTTPYTLYKLRAVPSARHRSLSGPAPCRSASCSR